MSPSNGAPPARATGKRGRSSGGRKNPPDNDNKSKRIKSSSNNANALKLSPNAVRKMLLAEEYKGPLTVALHCTVNKPVTSFVAGHICDNSFQGPVLISRDHFQKLPRPRTHQWWLIKVNGYVTSTVNAAGGTTYPLFQPFLCLTSFANVPTTDATHTKPWEDLLHNKRTLIAHQEKLPGGTSAPFIHRYLNKLETADLWGESMIPFGQYHPQDLQDNQKVVQDFLMHHKAMKNLQDSHSNLMIHHSNSTNSEEEEEKSQDNPPTNMPKSTQQHNNEHYQMYNAALREFAASQLDRQKASLTSNAGRATAMDASKVVEQYKATLEQVLQDCLDPDWLTIEKFNLKALHLQLCGNGLHQNAGEFRTNNVKAGRTVFCPADQVPGHLENSLLPTLRTLQQRLQKVPNSSNHSSDQEKALKMGLACLTFGCAVFFGIVDLHPFADGNGRLARLLSQGALAALQLPFCINWFATPAQRREYVLAILMTRRNLSLVYRGDETAEDVIAKCLKATGVYYPLVALLMDRVRKAIPELVQLQKDKQASAAEHDEARAARRARERAAAGSCLICFDDNPNIATLCCGKAVHLTCIAEWLSSNNSCPNCRGNFPALPSRPARRAGSEEDETTDDVDDTTTDDGSDQDDTTVVVVNGGGPEQVVNGGGQEQEQDEADTTDDVPYIGFRYVYHDPPGHQYMVESEADDTTDDTTELEIQNDPNDPPDDTTTDDDDDDDDDNTATIQVDGPHDTSDEAGETTDDTSAAVAAALRQNGGGGTNYCAHCRNTAALECTNTCCGRCCLLHGQWRCARHANGI